MTDPAPLAVAVDLPRPGRALAIGAHPTTSSSGAERRWPSGPQAPWCTTSCGTDGSKGTRDPTRTCPRRRCARPNSAPRPLALGATGEVVFLGWPDGELASGIRQRWEVAYWTCRSPTSCSATTRGSGIGCTLTTATPGS